MKKIQFVLIASIFVCPYVGIAQNSAGMPAGNIGIGTTTPQGPLHIYNNANTASILLESNSAGWGSGMIFKNTAASGRAFGIYSSAYGTLCISDNGVGVNRLYINPVGNIGIGTDNPLARLDVRTSGANGGDQYALNLNNPSNDPYSTVSLNMGVSDITSSMISCQRSNIGNGSSLYFHTTDASGVLQPRMWIGQDGNIGIGTLYPSEKLAVNGRVVIEAEYANGSIGGSLFLRHPGKTANGAARDWAIYNMAGQYGNSLQFWAYDNLGCGESGGLCNSRMTIMDNGNVGIGTITPQAKLAVNGDIFSKKVKVTQTGWADYVFDSLYSLQPLADLERFVKQNKHLPEIPSAAEIEKDGLDLGKNQAALLKKIEELTLYVIELKKENEALGKKIDEIAKGHKARKRKKQ